MKKGYAVTHSLEKEFTSARELTDAMEKFLDNYNSKYCHSLDLHLTEVGMN
ncbi:MAG: hypothetical protein GKS07_11210 [Nitrosopumilus sp.]|nr:MAG: hypothetical protein GKS07_11210 [Nitrosopumilus sp.]